MILALLLMLQAPAQAAELSEVRITRLETQVVHFTSTLARIENKLDKFGDEQNHDHPISEQWPVGILGLLLALDKAGYYLGRNGKRGDK